MRRSILFVLLGTAATSTATAKTVTLADCLALAHQAAPVLAAADADLSRADQAIREARAALSPTLHFSTNLVQNSVPQKVVFALPGGGSSQSFKIASATVLDARLAADYTLYSGGRDPARVHAAEEEKTRSVHAREQADADLVQRVSEAYYRVLAAQRLQSAAREVIASSLSHLTTSAARVRAGVTPRLDSLRASGDLEERKTSLVRASEAVRVARDGLDAAIGAPLDSTAELADPGDPALAVPEVAPAIDRALAARPELAAYDAALREADRQLEAARAAKRPTVSLNATAQYLGPNLHEDYWDPSHDGLRTQKFFAGVALSVPILDAGLADARAGQIAADHLRLEAERQDEVLAIRREVERAVSDLRVALAAWQSDAVRVTTAREAVRLADAGYRGGTVTATDVRDAEAALADSRASEALSLMNYWTALASLDHATGATTGKGR